MNVAVCERCVLPFEHAWGRREPRWCPPCRRVTYRASERRKRYGIEPEQYAAMVEAQSNLCAICGEPETISTYGRVRELDVDHDHETGIVRGLLCSRCNRGVGTFLDDPARLRAAAEYLECRARR